MACCATSLTASRCHSLCIWTITKLLWSCWHWWSATDNCKRVRWVYLRSVCVLLSVHDWLNETISQRLAQHFYCTRSPFHNVKSLVSSPGDDLTSSLSLEAQVKGNPLEKDREGVRKLATKEEFLTVTQGWSKLFLVSPRSTPNTTAIKAPFRPVSDLRLVQIWRLWLKADCAISPERIIPTVGVVPLGTRKRKWHHHVAPLKPQQAEVNNSLFWEVQCGLVCCSANY